MRRDVNAVIPYALDFNVRDVARYISAGKTD